LFSRWFPVVLGHDCLEVIADVTSSTGINNTIVTRSVFPISKPFAIPMHRNTTMSHQEIASKLSTYFEKALNSGDIFFFPSTIVKHADPQLGVEFEIRLCPSLQKKEQLPTPDRTGAGCLIADASLGVQAAARRKYDPFAPPYNPNLHVGDLQDANGQAYAVLLNKYAVVPQHFLLVTKDLQSQSSPLMPSDLIQSYLLLVAAKKTGQNLLAFYNCGDNSGASQPHKHIQFIPTGDDGPPVERLARSVGLETSDKPFSLTQLLYANHVFRFPAHLSSFAPDKVESILSTAFLSLLDLCISTIRHDPAYPPGRPSYNVLITLEHMHLIPRGKETHRLPEIGETLGVNALGFAGMLLVKNDMELEALKNGGIGEILLSVGLRSIHDLQVAGTSIEAE